MNACRIPHNWSNKSQRYCPLTKFQTTQVNAAFQCSRHHYFKKIHTIIELFFFTFQSFWHTTLIIDIEIWHQLHSEHIPTRDWQNFAACIGIYVALLGLPFLLTCLTCVLSIFNDKVSHKIRNIFTPCNQITNEISHISQ